MTKLIPIKLEDGTEIFMETREDLEIDQDQEVNRRVEKGEGNKNSLPQQGITQSFKLVEKTIKAYTDYSLNAFRKVANANIDKVTLEFGIKVGGKAGIPYVTEGSTDSHLKITVECSFPNEQK
jgi:hypothetical protein